MGKKEEQEASNLRPLYRHEKEQKCFIGHTYNASWRAVIAEVCDEVLPTFGLRPWYADAHFDPTTSPREKVVEMIAHARYGIYDLSYWRMNEQSPWEMPRNVLIELGMAIALNRPTLLLRHAENRVAGLALPDCLQSVDSSFCEFTGGKKSLRNALTMHLPHWIKRSPEQEWRNRYCLFGGNVCDHRDAHPLSPHTIQNNIACHIADGQDTDKDDFRASIEEIIERFESVGFHYSNDYSLPHGYNYSLCSQCQLVRSTPFAIYRLSANTSAETFITIGMSIALEEQFKYKIPKILLANSLEHVPSLLTGYEVVVTRNDQEMRTKLAQFLPQVIQRVRETTWRPQALPLEVYIPAKDMQQAELEKFIEDEIKSPEAHEKTDIHDFAIICNPENKDWIPWICWVLEQTGHTVNAAIVTNTKALRDAIILADRQATSLLLVLSPKMLERLNETELPEIQSARSRLVAIQTYRGSIHLQPGVARRLMVVDLFMFDEQAALTTLLRLVFDRDAQRQSMIEEFRRRVSSTEEMGDSKPHFPREISQRKKKVIEIFYCYAYKDERLRNELDKHLFNLKRQGLITGWYDHDISAGTEWEHEIDTRLNSAQIILLLISPDFLASEYCYSIEMKRALERHEAGEARVIPVLFQPVDWQDAPFKKMQVLPKNAKPVTRWKNRAEAFLDITKGIRETIKELYVNVE